MATPILFVKTGCPYCKDAIAFLDERGIQYDPVDVRAHPERMPELEKISGQHRTPTMVAAGDVLADFGVEELEPFLKKHQLA